MRQLARLNGLPLEDEEKEGEYQPEDLLEGEEEAEVSTILTFARGLAQEGEAQTAIKAQAEALCVAAEADAALEEQTAVSMAAASALLADPPGMGSPDPSPTIR